MTSRRFPPPMVAGSIGSNGPTERGQEKRLKRPALGSGAKGVSICPGATNPICFKGISGGLEMRRTSLLLLAIAALSMGAVNVALAADLGSTPTYPSPPSAFSWTGFYIGGNAGGTWNNVDLNSNFTCPAGVACPVEVPQNLRNISAAAGKSFSDDAFTGGGQLGYNWQTGRVVFGIETDLNSFNLHGSRSSTVPSATSSSIFHPQISFDTDWLYTLRGRLGWAATPTVLLYATGGLAVTEVEVRNSYTSPISSSMAAGRSSNSDAVTGWTVGGGGEWAFAGRWSARAEYLFVDFGSISTTAKVTSPIPVQTFSQNPNFFSTSADLKGSIVRGAINYKFWGPGLRSIQSP